MPVHVRFELVPGLFSGDLFSILLILCHARAIGRHERRHERPVVTTLLFE